RCCTTTAATTAPPNWRDDPVSSCCTSPRALRSGIGRARSADAGRGAGRGADGQRSRLGHRVPMPADLGIIPACTGFDEPGDSLDETVDLLGGGAEPDTRP